MAPAKIDYNPSLNRVIGPFRSEDGTIIGASIALEWDHQDITQGNLSLRIAVNQNAVEPDRIAAEGLSLYHELLLMVATEKCSTHELLEKLNKKFGGHTFEVSTRQHEEIESIFKNLSFRHDHHDDHVTAELKEHNIDSYIVLCGTNEHFESVRTQIWIDHKVPTLSGRFELFANSFTEPKMYRLDDSIIVIELRHIDLIREPTEVWTRIISSETGAIICSQHPNYYLHSLNEALQFAAEIRPSEKERQNLPLLCFETMLKCINDEEQDLIHRLRKLEEDLETSQKITSKTFYKKIDCIADTQADLLKEIPLLHLALQSFDEEQKAGVTEGLSLVHDRLVQLSNDISSVKLAFETKTREMVENTKEPAKDIAVKLVLATATVVGGATGIKLGIDREMLPLIGFAAVGLLGLALNRIFLWNKRKP